MARRSRVAAGRGTRRRAAPAWGFLSTGLLTTIPADTKTLLGSFILSNPPLGETILRTRCRVWILSDQAAAVEEQIGAFGLIVVSDRAIVAGAASIPGPFTDGGDDGWFVHQSIVQANQGAATFVGGTPYDIDSKAMRKVEDGSEIAVMIENAPQSDFGFKVGFAIRMLSKLTES